MWEKIIKEKISADHLLHVSLKFTKTGDVIVNLLLRWKSMLESSFEAILEQAKKKKKIAAVPEAPRMKIEKLKEMYKKDPFVLKIISLYEMFRQIETLPKQHENEFRKNITLKVLYKGETININMDKLKEYSNDLATFISYMQQLLAK